MILLGKQNAAFISKLSTSNRMFLTFKHSDLHYGLVNGPVFPFSSAVWLCVTLRKETRRKPGKIVLKTITVRRPEKCTKVSRIWYCAEEIIGDWKRCRHDSILRSRCRRRFVSLPDEENDIAIGSALTLKRFTVEKVSISGIAAMTEARTRNPG